MRWSVTGTTSAVIIALASAANACPDFPGPGAKALGGPAGYTVMGRMKPVPPPKTHLPVPDGPLAGVRITLQRGGCFGDCPVYALVLSGDGHVHYKGAAFVLITGEHDFTIDPETARCLVEDFRASDFWSLAPSYTAPITDNPHYAVTLEIGGQKKTVTDYVGRAVGMPAAVTALEETIDRVGGDRFVQGNAETVPALRAEHFDFHSAAAAVLVANAARMGGDQAVFDLLAEGAAATGHVQMRPREPGEADDGPTAVETAAGRGATAVVRALIAAGALPEDKPQLRIDAVSAAAASGVPATVMEILKLKPDVGAHDATSPLLRIKDIDNSLADRAQVDAAEAEVVRLLLDASADPRARNEDGGTPLHWANGARMVELLLKAGADIEARDNNGRTPLLSANDDDAALALLMAGADVHAVAKDGDTIDKTVVQYKYVKAQAWLKAHRSTSTK